MKKIFLVAALLLCTPLAACEVSSGSSPGPIAACERTKADEKAVIGMGLAYKAFRKTVEIGVNAGFIKGELAGTVASADRTAFAAVSSADTIYRTCSGDLYEAIDSANRSINAAVAVIPINTNPPREQ